MASLNKVQIIGNITRDPEVRFTPKGSAVCDIGIAVNRSYKDDTGKKIEEVTFMDVVLWAKLAELAGQYLHKGSPVFLEGRLQTDTWNDKATGQQRSKLKIVGENMQFLGGKREGGDAAPAGREQERAPAGRNGSGRAPAKEEDWGAEFDTSKTSSEEECPF